MIVMWLDAAEGGDPSAQYQLGWCHEHGQGAIMDLGLACRWYLRAARQGHARAQYHYGLACSNGAPGVAWSRVEACKWLTLAARAGIDEAARALDAFKLSTDEQLEGTLAAKRFVPVPEAQRPPSSPPVGPEPPGRPLLDPAQLHLPFGPE
jgi:TPR repeat protein